ncbi:MAG: hypothetical protein HQ514_19890 [Rhodospirillales bacterium]|nr:hypothetical protein [Rhodospirillales bacterium]
MKNQWALGQNLANIIVASDIIIEIMKNRIRAFMFNIPGWEAMFGQSNQANDGTRVPGHFQNLAKYTETLETTTVLSEKVLSV